MSVFKRYSAVFYTRDQVRTQDKNASAVALWHAAWRNHRSITTVCVAELLSSDGGPRCGPTVRGRRSIEVSMTWQHWSHQCARSLDSREQITALSAALFTGSRYLTVHSRPIILIIHHPIIPYQQTSYKLDRCYLRTHVLRFYASLNRTANFRTNFYGVLIPLLELVITTRHHWNHYKPTLNQCFLWTKMKTRMRTEREPKRTKKNETEINEARTKIKSRMMFRTSKFDVRNITRLLIFVRRVSKCEKSLSKFSILPKRSM